MPLREEAVRLRDRAGLPVFGRLCTPDLLAILPHVGLSLARPRTLEPPLLGWLRDSELTVSLHLPETAFRGVLAWSLAHVALDQPQPEWITATPADHARAGLPHHGAGRVAELAGWLLCGYVRIHDLRQWTPGEVVEHLGLREMISLGWRDLAIEAHRQRHLWERHAVSG